MISLMKNMLRTDRAYSKQALQFLKLTPRMRAQRTLISKISQLHASQKVPQSARFDVVDAGCGAGPDLARFLKAGFRAIGLDRVPEMLRVAEEHLVIPEENLKLGCMTDFGKLFPENGIVSIWCRSALFNVPSELYPSVLQQFSASLIPDGILFLRLKVGQGILHREDGRTEKLFEKSEISDSLVRAGFCVARIIDINDELGRSNISWMGVWARKISS